MENRYQKNGRVEELKGRTKRCCCKYCGGKLELRRIVFNDDEDARVELFCGSCNRIEYGVEPEIYRNALCFVEHLKFNHYPDLDNNAITKRMNVAKVCDIMTWSEKNLGLLDANGFKVPVTSCSEVVDGCWVITRSLVEQRRDENG